MTEATAAAAELATIDAPLTPYDDIAYTSTTIPRIDPARLAAIGMLHGIDTAPAQTARVLEVGAGEALNLTAFAMAFPHSQCLAFDLAPTAVACGRALATAAGIENIRIERMDILDAAETLDGEFDYILVHGVYAWVPAPVREAIFRLIRRSLAPNGIAAVSYNALPGQQLSLALRTMIGAAVEDLPAGEARVDRAIEILKEFAEGAKESDNAFVTAMRDRAKALAGRPRALLAHDEFGSCFEPQSFLSVCEAADRVGLAYLNDSVYLPWEHGFPGSEIDEAALRRLLHINDHELGCLFRHSLFVHDEVAFSRGFDPVRAQSLLLSSSAPPEGGGKFFMTDGTVTIPDQRLELMLREAARCYPEQLPLAGLSDDRITLLVRLFLGNAITLSAAQTAAGGVSEKPRLSPLVRAQIERGDSAVAGLDRSMTPLSDDMKRLLLMLDGTRDAKQMAAEVGFGEGEARAFIGTVSQRALLMR